MTAASAIVAFAPPGGSTQWFVAAALAAALVLDTADGRLARLQGTASPFGRWLDNMIDEFADLALHTSIAWACFVGTGNAVWLILGLAFASGKYLFFVQSTAGEILDHELTAHNIIKVDHDRPLPTVRPVRQQRLRTVVRVLGHADVRWHLWIAFALIGRLDIILAWDAFYFLTHTGLSCLRRGVRHACS
jgi:phosphatidylglycerophosphate synthase